MEQTSSSGSWGRGPGCRGPRAVTPQGTPRSGEPPSWKEEASPLQEEGRPPVPPHLGKPFAASFLYPCFQNASVSLLLPFVKSRCPAAGIRMPPLCPHLLPVLPFPLLPWRHAFSCPQMPLPSFHQVHTEIHLDTPALKTWLLHLRGQLSGTCHRA